MIECTSNLLSVSAVCLAMEHEFKIEQVAYALGAIEQMTKALKEAKAMFEAAIIPHLQAGPITVGVTLLTLGKERKVKCVDRMGVLEAIITACGGDMGTATEYFASEPFKQGSIKKLVGEDAWAKLFEVEYSEDVKYKQLDTRFIG